MNLSMVPSKDSYYDLAPYGFPGFEGSNIATKGDNARGFMFRFVAENEMYFHDDYEEYDAPTYGSEGSHWIRAAARMQQIKASIEQNDAS